MEKILNKILLELEKAGKKQKDLCEFLGINGNVFTAWKSGKNKSYEKHLPKIAEFFGISIDELIGKEKSSANAELGEKDRILIEAYHMSAPLVKSTVDRLLGIEENPKTVKIAARDGTFEERVITEDEWEKIKNLPDADL